MPNGGERLSTATDKHVDEVVKFLDSLESMDFHHMDTASFIRLRGAMADALDRSPKFMDVVRDTNQSWSQVVDKVIEVDGERYLGKSAGLFRLTDLVFGQRTSNRTLMDLGRKYAVDLVRGLIYR